MTSLHRAPVNVTTTRRSAGAFIGLVIALSVPIWVAGHFLGILESLKIPASDLAIGFVPAGAAVTLTAVCDGRVGVSRLLARAVDVRAIPRKRWLLPAILIPPAGDALAVLIMRASGDAGVPGLSLLSPAVPLIFLGLLVGAAGEELGWTGYLTDPLQKRVGPLGAACVIAPIWWIWHYPSMLQIGGASPAYMGAWLVGAFALRILISWLYNNTGGSVFAVVLFHAMFNISRLLSYPPQGDHYDLGYMAVGYAIPAALAIAVIVVSGPRLRRHRAA